MSASSKKPAEKADWKDQIRETWLKTPEQQRRVLDLPTSYPLDAIVIGMFNGQLGQYQWILRTKTGASSFEYVSPRDYTTTAIDDAAHVIALSKLMATALEVDYLKVAEDMLRGAK